MTPAAGLLGGLRVVDRSDGLAGAYCARLLSDLGADVLAVEPEGGNPFRRWSSSGSVGRDGDPNGALYRTLYPSTRSAVGDRDDVVALARHADVVLGGRDLDPAELLAVNPAVVVVAVSPFGSEGPDAGGDASEFLLQARAGSTFARGLPGRVPLALGGQLGEWAAGVHAALGAVTAARRARLTGRGGHVDVSMLEAIAVTMAPHATLAASFPGGRRVRMVLPMVPSIEPCRDGFVGLFTVTGQQWLDFLSMIERPDLADDAELATVQGRAARIDEMRAIVHAWTMARTAAEIVEQASYFRVPAAFIGNGETLPTMDHVVARAMFAPNERGGFPTPASPFRTSSVPATPRRAAPTLGQHDGEGFPSRAAGGALGASDGPRPGSVAGAAGGDVSSRPLAGVRVLDLTAFWAGPFATLYLASMGADVIKIESVQRPDPIRFSAFVPPTTPQWHEQAVLYCSSNLGKRGITLNLAHPEGRDLVLRLAAQCDVVAENFTPRVMEQFRLTYEELVAVRPDLVMLRMPAFGLDGPWRDRPGFATTIEQLAGLAWISGYEDGPPVAPAGMCDPLTGAHAALAIIAALEHRDRTGEGQHIELAMLEVGALVASEQVAEYHAYGQLLGRQGNRGPHAAPQGVYACAEDETWIAVAVATDAQWAALVDVLGRPAWSLDTALATAPGRRARHDLIDRELAGWFGARRRDDAAPALRAAGVPVSPVVPGYEIDDDPQLRARGFFEAVDHPVVGRHAYPGWPARLSDGPPNVFASAAPLLGQHNDEVLGGLLGLGADELARLRELEVIGEHIVGM